MVPFDGYEIGLLRDLLENEIAGKHASRARGGLSLLKTLERIVRQIEDDVAETVVMLDTSVLANAPLTFFIRDYDQLLLKLHGEF